MERSSLIIIALFLFNISTEIYSQGLFVQYNHPVYSFLESMEAQGLIQNFSNQSKPLQRSKIAEYLSIILDRRFELGKMDRELLTYFVEEFYYDITGRLDKYQILISRDKYNLGSDKEKFIYAYSDKDEFSFFLKSHFNFSSLQIKNEKPAQLFELGGRLYGSFKNLLGFEIDGKNGLVFGSKSTALQLHELSYNYKLNEREENRFFDKAYGYVMLEFPNINLSIGKNRKTIGHGINKLILSDYSPEFDKVDLNLYYKAFEFNFSHGWLQKLPSLSGGYLNQRYFAHHRLSFSPVNILEIGIGEAVIYTRTSPELSYLNPFNFYKSVEHQLQDQDNTLLYFDFEIIPIKGSRLYSTFLIDDIDFSKIGKKWHGNKTAINIGYKIYHQIFDYPVDLQMEYTRIEPYTFTHRIDDLSYTNFNLPLATDQPPNSYRYDFLISSDLSPYLNIKTHYSFTKWGRNFIQNGKLVNVGGNILFGKQETDQDTVNFLDGKIEKINSFGFDLSYEFIRNIKLISSVSYSVFSSGSSSLILLIGLISFL